MLDLERRLYRVRPEFPHCLCADGFPLATTRNTSLYFRAPLMRTDKAEIQESHDNSFPHRPSCNTGSRPLLTEGEPILGVVVFVARQAK